ncbi:NADPH:quinone oxidoreductase family protein [Methylobacterium sp. A54F]
MRRFVGASFGSLDSFGLAEADVPQPAAGEVRIRVEAAALGFVDGLIVQGRYQIRPPLPYVPGGEIAGVVDAIGPGVETVSPGERVVTWQLGGGLAESVCVDAGTVDPIPAGLAPATAAAMLVDYQTARYALVERARLCRGERVLVLGAMGGVGSAALQLAVRAGALVIAAASTAEKRDAARRLGAHHVIDSSAPDMRAQLQACAPGGVVDVVVDPVGGAGFEAMFRSLAKEGRHLVIGFAGGDIPALPTNLALLKSAALVGVEIRHYLASQPDKARADRMALLNDVAAGALEGPRLAIYALDRARDALAATWARDRFGKVVVLPGD